LFLQNNELVGPINDDSFAGLQLVDLDLSDNLITGYFPEHFYEYEVVDLHNNALTGSLPQVRFQGLPIRYLSLYKNEISGTISGNTGLLTELIHLDLSYNKFGGSIPNTINNMVKLEYLFLHRNNFEAGEVPEVRDLRNLKELVLKGTNRISTIPESIGYLSSLWRCTAASSSSIHPEIAAMIVQAKESS